jgi:hypothetical protein
MADEWVTQAELEELQKPLDAPGLYEAVAMAKIKKKAIDAASTLIDLAMNAENENVRLRAAMYVLDRSLGPVNNPIQSAGGVKQPWERVLDSVLVEPNKNTIPDPPSYPFEPPSPYRAIEQ